MNYLRFEPHSHTHYSNIRLLDCINKPKALINRAVELGLAGIAITDHECLAGHPEVNIYYNDVIKKDHPEFKVALGNEIYLCPNRDRDQSFYHFILIAKNKTGHRALRELSSTAWLNIFETKRMERVVTTYDDLDKIVKKYPGSLIATTACIGGEVSKQTLALISAERAGDSRAQEAARNDIGTFIERCQSWFGDDFYIECAPGMSPEQQAVNERLVKIAECFGIKMVIGTDAHYLTKEDRYVHKAYLKSKEGEREVDKFYEFSYLQSEEDILTNLNIKDKYEELCNNSMEIWNKIEMWDMRHPQQIPKVEVEHFNKKNIKSPEYPTLSEMFMSDNEVERCWVNKCYNRLLELNKCNETYLSRLEEEARVKKIIGQKLQTNMFSYPLTLQHYCDLFWKCGSIVGAGRGSSCSGLNHYLLGITQLDPIEWELPFWRYLNEERTELGDIDLDLCPSKRPLILNEIKKERGKNFIPEVDDGAARSNLGCTLIATFGTESTRSAILTACRGYRSEECPQGIDTDIAKYLSSLIPEERGFVWSIDDIINGNEEKGRKPLTSFIQEVEQYPGLLTIIQGIDGLVNKRSSHASGVILFDEDPFEFGCFMRTPNWEIITQYDLHMDEACGLTKYDFLVTEIQDKIAITINLLQKHGEIEQDLSLREVYDKYLNPNVLPIEDMKYWKRFYNMDVINVFQFDSPVGKQAAKKIKPISILELADANGLMRLMTAEKGEITPMDKYVMFKNNIELWYNEMREYGLTEQEMEVVKPYFLKSHGVPPSQEQMMKMLMDPDICGFTLAEANTARKIVGKKQMNKIPALRDKVLEQAKSPCLGHYIWKCGIGPQMGYSFSIIHALAYSFIGFQTVYLATNWDPIYWDTACLIVNSCSTDEEDEDDDIIDVEEDEKEEQIEEEEVVEVSAKKKTKTVDYGKNAKALGEIISNNIKVSLIDINKSSLQFEPDVENQQILFGFRALTGVNVDIIKEIVAKRPFVSLTDFMNRCKIKKPAMISLIKAGAFDNLKEEINLAKELGVEPRIAAMMLYIWRVSEPKTNINLQSFNGLLEKDLVPREDLDFEIRVFHFNKAMKYFKENVEGTPVYYFGQDNMYDFYAKYFDLDQVIQVGSYFGVPQKYWDKVYTKTMDKAREWLKNNKQFVLNEVNYMNFKELWDKYASGTVASWEIDSLGFYYHEHDLANVNMKKYGIVDYQDLPETPEVDYHFTKGKLNIPIFKTSIIIGTVIAKDDKRSTVSILTPTGVVDVKFSKEYYANYKRQISEVGPDGKKKVIEKGWFRKGVQIMVTGFRREDTFVAKSYSKTATHQLYKITEVDDNGNISLVHDRSKAA